MTINTTDNPSPLERALASLTDGPQRTEDEVISGGLWLKALEQSAPTSAQPIPLLKRTIPAPWLSAAAVLILFVLTAAIMMPAMSKHRGVDHAAMTPGAISPSTAPGIAMGGGEPGELADVRKYKFNTGDDAELRGMGRARTAPEAQIVSDYLVAGTPPPPPPPSSSSPSQSSAHIPADRYVIRKTTLDLTATDVRTAFSKANLVINEALGEYVETSSLTGEGPTARATITLRVAANHLSDALNKLRPLGTVVSEASTGQDVTDTVVDLEARLRNEQRIERELLALIDKRPDAPLKDLMEIRSQLEQVRGQIEYITGQRERVGRLVSLATILVTINAAEAPPKPVEKEKGIGDYFKESMSSAWHNSLVALADTAAFLIRTLIGGIVWWIFAIIAATAVWKLSKRILAKQAAEPVPVG